MPRCRLSLLACLALLPAACTAVHDDLSRQLLRPPAGWLADPQDFGLDAEPFAIELHSEASLTGWWIPSAAAAGRTVVLLHEEATNVSAQHPYYTFLHEAGFNVLAFDPRGYGRSRGTPTLRAWLHDLDAVFDWLHRRADVDGDKIALFGTGMGSVAAMWAARMHRECRAVVFEHLPSLRAMLRESMHDDGSALSAYSLGLAEFSLPEDIEPEDNAPRTEAHALFLATANENERDRLSLLRTHDAYAGDKWLVVLADAGRAPHAMLTHDGQYQRLITDFLSRAFAGTAHSITASVRKVRDASDGEAWYEIGIELDRQGDDAPWAIEACAMLPGGTPRYVRAWIAGQRGDVRIKLPSAPTHVTATRVFAATRDDAAVFVSDRTWLSRSGAAIAPLWPRIEQLRNEAMSRADCLLLAADLTAAAAAEKFHPTLEAELASVYARIGLELAADAATRVDAIAWLEHAVAAAPERPTLHFWPGPVATYGDPYGDAVTAAGQRLQQLRSGN
ncbi:MAG: alpha/beta fold hydrolase [Planctomycetes bacterium]|nr:alpha/beta fold hydrolase [Planctomycetota bacterium]